MTEDYSWMPDPKKWPAAYEPTWMSIYGHERCLGRRCTERQRQKYLAWGRKMLANDKRMKWINAHRFEGIPADLAYAVGQWSEDLFEWWLKDQGIPYRRAPIIEEANRPDLIEQDFTIGNVTVGIKASAPDDVHLIFLKRNDFYMSWWYFDKDHPENKIQKRLGYPTYLVYGGVVVDRHFSLLVGWLPTAFIAAECPTKLTGMGENKKWHKDISQWWFRPLDGLAPVLKEAVREANIPRSARPQKLSLHGHPREGGQTSAFPEDFL